MGGLLRKLKRFQAKQAKAAGIGEGQAPHVPACDGMPEGFLIGEVIARSIDWEVILHPDIKEYTVRKKGTDATAGLLIRLPESVAAAVAVDRGVPWIPGKEKPPEGANIIVQVEGKCWYLPMAVFVNEILDGAMPPGAASEAAQ